MVGTSSKLALRNLLCPSGERVAHEDEDQPLAFGRREEVEDEIEKESVPLGGIFDVIYPICLLLLDSSSLLTRS